MALHYDDRITPTELFDEHLRWAKRHADPLTRAATTPHANERNPERRLRIGYVSGDFRLHSVAFFLEPILAAHNRGAVEVFC